jgi:xylan 1,4-beta-xylosidase
MITISNSSCNESLRMPWKQSVAVGRAYELLRHDLLEHLAFLQREIGFEYTRFHAIFHDDMNVYHEDAQGRACYQWHHVDKVLDETLKLGLRHIIELNPMPSALASGETTMFAYQMNVTPPKSYEKWEALVRAFVEHVVERYGRREIATWYFEVWNEPDLQGFWTGTREEYWRLYEASARAVKAVDPQFRIGGPATSKGAWVGDFIEHCVDNHVPLDFVSTHEYPQDEYCLYPERNGSPHEPGMFFVDTVKGVKETLQRSPRPDLPLLYTEWNTQCGKPGREVTWTRNEDVDNLHAASLICHLCTALDKTVEAMTWWVASDIFEEGGIPPEPFSCTYGLLTVRGTPKASFHAFKLLSRMTGQLLAVDLPPDRPGLANAIATTEDGRVKVLLWNHIPHEVEASAWQETLSLALPDALKMHDSLQVLSVHLREGKGSAYETWVKLGRPLNLTRLQEDLIEAHSRPEYGVRAVSAQEGLLKLPVSLAPDEVLFLEIAPAGPSVSILPEGAETDAWNQVMSDLSRA